MRILLQSLRELPEYAKLAALVADGGTPAAVSGLSSVHKSHFAAALIEQTKLPAVIICADELEAERVHGDLSQFLGETPIRLPARDFIFHNVESASRQWEQRRLSALLGMSGGGTPVTVCTIEALLQRTLPPEKLRGAAFILEAGHEYKIDGLIEGLLMSGYSRSVQVEGPGQFAARGGILDFYSPAHASPVRVEFFGDEIDSVGIFDVDTQRRVKNIEKVTILPAAEALTGLARDGMRGFVGRLEDTLAGLRRAKDPNPALISNMESDIERIEAGRGFAAADRYMGLIYDEMATAADYIKDNALIIIFEHTRVSESADGYTRLLSDDIKNILEAGLVPGNLANYAITDAELWHKLRKRRMVMLDSFASPGYPAAPRSMQSVTAKQLTSYGGSLDTAISEISHYAGAGMRTVVLCGGKRRAAHLHEMLNERSISSVLDYSMEGPVTAGTVTLALGSLSAGFEYPSCGLAVITEGQLTHMQTGTKAKARKKSARETVRNYADLSKGDLVVHENHGVGRFTGIERMVIDGVTKDYIRIAYAGADSLFIPATALDSVSKYIGAGEGAPVRLHKLGGTEWHRVRSRAKGAAKELAQGLIKLYAERRRIDGHAFSEDNEWQLEFEEAFEYDETADQLKCIAEIKRDMRSSIPMDRLLCGDVGFGKTEVAFRAVMKCVLDSKQAALLVPTTVLAWQHYVTATERFSNYPVRVEMLSRFCTPAQVKATVKKLKSGEADFVIGTHRLLQKDVVFHELGLLIVDEEQRFGVSHKERLKEMSRGVDALTLTATPIPRTLNMALSGIRDMSTIEEPPRDRHPVQTYVLEYEFNIIADAVRREVARGGQVYYLHNRIDSIERTAAKLRAVDDSLVIATAHGKMGEAELGGVMRAMADGEIHVLVCTTIIETGIDIPNVNTLIIEDANHLGLAQLHQIRGRVGRSSRHAFAYFTYRAGKILSEVETKRLSAIREFTEFGSGFKIAMRDLEIRGAGNILGPEQHGAMMSVGYDMYLKLLEEAVLEERGEQAAVRVSCSADFAVDANIPESYVASAEQRMDLYHRIAKLVDREGAGDLTDELIDRFGEPPESVVALIEIALLRHAASRLSITEISQKDMLLSVKFQAVDLKRVSVLCSELKYRKRLLFSAGESPYITLRLQKGGVLRQAHELVSDYASGDSETAQGKIILQ